MNSVIEVSMLVSLVEWLMIASVKTIPLILLVLILQRLCRRFFSAAAHHLLWFTVLSSLVIPVGWNINIEPAAEQFVSAVHQTQLDDDAVTQQTIINDNSISTINSSSVVAVRDVNWLELAENNFLVLMALTWLLGVIALLAVTLIKARDYYRIKQQAIRVTPKVTQLFEDCKKKMHFSSSVNLYCSREISTPIVMGLMQPAIIIPVDIEKSLTPEQLQYVLLHELGHIKRHDIAFNWLVSLINIFHWFNPFVWFACRRMRTDMEAACDALVLSHLPKKQHKHYGETLIELSDFLPYSPRAISAVGILENHHELKERLKMIKQIKTMNVKRIVLFGVILVGAAVTAFAQPSQKVPTGIKDTIGQAMTLQDFALMTEEVFKSDVLVNAKDADTPVRIRANISELDYSKLLTQLKRNGFTAYKSNGAIHFIQTRYARHSPIPVVEKNKTYFDDEYVTEYVKLEKSCSAQLLPVLRPLVPQDSHLALMYNPQTLLFSDTYLNIQRIKAVIKQIEGEMEKPADCTNVKLPE